MRHDAAVAACRLDHTLMKFVENSSLPMSTSAPASDTPASNTRAQKTGPPPDWRYEVKSAIRDARELGRVLGLDSKYVDDAQRATGQFPLFAPLSYVARMQRGDPADPLLRQVLPTAGELVAAPGYSADPVADRAATILPGMLHKYDGRALLVATGRCAVHCRYCFRRNYPYEDGPRSPDEWAGALEHLRTDRTIEEVILSGGDPLTLVDSTLSELVKRLADVPHLRRLRVHTRFPIVIPARVTQELVDLLNGSRLTPIMVVHANHPAELNDEVARALAKLNTAGVPLLNQSVLLAGVNDDFAVLKALMERLVELRVLPYYLHQLDRVTGAAHFEVSDVRGQELVAQLRDHLPGYMVPRFVRDVPGQSAKQMLAAT